MFITPVDYLFIKIEMFNYGIILNIYFTKISEKNYIVQVIPCQTSATVGTLLWRKLVAHWIGTMNSSGWGEKVAKGIVNYDCLKVPDPFTMHYRIYMNMNIYILVYFADPGLNLHPLLICFLVLLFHRHIQLANCQLCTFCKLS